MAETILFKCPACGGNLEFDPGEGRFVCGYCGATYDEAELREQSERREREAQARENSGSSFREYHCSNCGAEIVVGDTTAATRCYYCHSPVVMSDRVSDEYRPDSVIPFQIDQEEARKRFDEYIRKKHFVDRRFFSAAQLEDFSGVYYPYWLGDVEGDASFSGEGKTVSTMTVKNTLITTTRYYQLERAGRLSFRNMVRKALKKADRQLSDGIHPYDQAQMEPFASGYLSGFMAEKRDVEQAEAEKDILEETEGYVEKLLTENSGLTGVKGKTSYTPDQVRMKYTLLPAWVLTYSHDVQKKVYYYMMNGQSGKVCGKLPLNVPKLLIFSGLLGLGVFGLMCAGGAFLW